MKNKIFCPCCEKELVITHQGRYESLDEHVSNPNGTPSLKDAYQCTNEYCIANNLNVSWTENGETFMRPPKEVKWTVAHDTIKKCSVSGMYYALNSWEHYYEKGKNNIKKRTIKIKIGKYKINIVPKCKGSKFSHDKQYEPSLFRFNIEYWKKSKDIKWAYTSIIPVHRMVRFCIRKFKRNYKSATYNPKMNSCAIKKCLEGIYGFRWGKQDDRLYIKISSALIKILYHKKVNVIKGLAIVWNVNLN